ncbi:hypothetical protein FNJ88_08600 [Chryseobacterium sp. SNU WT5]|uniref:hypothetical protein n=1 Tax=Chryseobacterium sp. SNU WT5 TaxID=2594269 RepID=UPI00117CA118|nr:hypothetical protein [Chryseobacterium sp. SNU WT5]QDP85619.1 hypothetical protein FNJ88_08600 [Chryseobacterium sp. SNU WT5]
MKQTKIVDAETGTAIPSARIIHDHQIYYSNDDGVVSLPKDSKQFEVSVAGYESLKSPKQQSIIKLKPLYSDIDEIKIVSIDVKKIFTDVYKNYEKRYYNQPAMYDVTYSQKRFENNKMKLLVVADGKFWTRDGQYNAKEAFNGKHKNFVQLQIDTLRYLKLENNDFNIKVKPQKVSHEPVGSMFFDYELFYMMRRSKNKNAVTSGKLLYENEFEQEISYKIKTENNEIYSGKIIFNKKDRAITYYEMNFDQRSYKPNQLKDADGNNYQYQPPNGTYVFDFYKSGEKYVPSKINIKYEGIKYTMGDKVFEYRNARDIIFKNFKPTEEIGVENSVEINGYFWKDMKINDDKGQVDLSKEEQDFINEKADEN